MEAESFDQISHPGIIKPKNTSVQLMGGILQRQSWFKKYPVFTMTLTCDNKNGDDPIPRKRKHVVSKKQQSKAKKTRQSLNNNTTQIESEFKVLQSLIPPIANRQQLTEVNRYTHASWPYVDICVTFLVSLKSLTRVSVTSRACRANSWLIRRTLRASVGASTTPSFQLLSAPTAMGTSGKNQNEQVQLEFIVFSLF